MKQTLHLELDVEFFQLEEYERAASLAENNNGAVYTWKTVGKHNWLENGVKIVDALGLVVLPDSLPGTIHMCDDEEE